jgi:hypothetical protein
MKPIYRFSIFISLIITSCGLSNQSDVSENKINIDTNELKKELKDKSVYDISDSIKFTDFQIIFIRKVTCDDYLENDSDYFSSKDSVFVRPIVNGTSSVNISLTLSEKKSFYNIIKRNDFYSLPDTINNFKSGNNRNFYYVTSLSIIIGDSIKKIFYSNFYNINDRQIANRLDQIDSAITNLVYNRKAIRSLPLSIDHSYGNDFH